MARVTLLGRPGYVRLWTARTLSQCGDVAHVTTVALLVYELTGSSIGVTAVVLAEVVPLVLLAPVAGVVVDRLPRVTVMVGSDLARMLLASVLVGAHDQVAVVYAVAFGLAAGSAFFNPAANSLLPSLVGEDELVSANSGIWSAAVLAQIMLAPAAGFVASTAGFGWAFAANAASFGLSAAVLRGLRPVSAARPALPSRSWAEGAEALRLLAHDRLLRALAIAQALAALSAGATSALLVVLAVERFGADGGGYGLMLAAIGAGALIGPLLLTRRSLRARPLRVLPAAFALRGAVDLVLATVTALPVALGALLCYGVGTSTGSVMFTTTLQTAVAADVRGRVFAAFDMIWQTMRLTSMFAGGVLATAAGIRAVYYLGGGLLLLAALAGVLASRGRGVRSPA